jgi:1-hydroxycarotenoid 3,4-desaturase
MLVAHVEQDGVWSIEGGMHRLALALQQLAASLGVVFRFSSHVRAIETSNGRVSAVALEGGERLRADVVVLNADPQALTSGLFDTHPRIRTRTVGRKRSLSAVTWATMAEAAGPALSRHNVFFSSDYRAEFDDIFNDGRLPRSPTVYICAQDRTDSEPWQSGDERLLVLINAPANGDGCALDEQELRECQTRVLDRLQRCGLTLRMGPKTTVATTPTDFNAMFPATGGALYGQATHGWAAAFQRPGPRTKIPGLYLAGGGAHPGAGVPMAALSGRLAAQRIVRDRDSTNPFRRAATRGGTLTP